MTCIRKLPRDSTRQQRESEVSCDAHNLDDEAREESAHNPADQRGSEETRKIRGDGTDLRRTSNTDD